MEQNQHGMVLLEKINLHNMVLLQKKIINPVHGSGSSADLGK